MRKSLKFILVTVWILVTRSYDAWSTFQYTPDLSREANPLASVFGLGWSPILLIVGVLCLYSIFAFYKSMFEEYAFLPSEKDLNFSEFTTYLYLGEKARWTEALYKLPSSWKRLNHYLGRYLTRCLVFVGFVSTAMWLGIWYSEFYKEAHSAVLIYSIIIAGCGLIAYLWNKNLYQDYNLQNS